MVLTIMIACLAACGVLLILWTMVEALLMPLPTEEAVLVLPLSGDGAQVEQQIRGCRWLREHRGLRARLLLVDQGLTPEGQIQVELLIRGQEGERLCAASQVAEYLELEKEKLGAGAD